MRMIRTIVSLTALPFVAFGQAGDSVPFLLDSTNDSLVKDPLSYNSSWVGGNSSATIVIADNGTEIYRGSGEGDFEWRPTTVGKHTLTYTTYINDVVQSEVYEATVYAGFKYEVVDGKAVITEASIDSDSVVIPNEIDGYNVNEIADGVFNGCLGLKKIVIPASV
jgi:hypothetical protein